MWNGPYYKTDPTFTRKDLLSICAIFVQKLISFFFSANISRLYLKWCWKARAIWKSPSPTLACVNEWILVSQLLLLFADLYPHTFVRLDSCLICYSHMSYSEAAVPLIWLPHPPGVSEPSPVTTRLPHQPLRRCLAISMEKAAPPGRDELAQEHFPPLCTRVCVREREKQGRCCS